jgi:hypothetical protein
VRSPGRLLCALILVLQTVVWLSPRVDVGASNAAVAVVTPRHLVVTAELDASTRAAAYIYDGKTAPSMRSCRSAAADGSSEPRLLAATAAGELTLRCASERDAADAATGLDDVAMTTVRHYTGDAGVEGITQ